MPGYAPTTVNFYDFYYVADGDRIVDVWPILARYGSATAGVGPCRDVKTPAIRPGEMR